jgi:GTP-binding protein
VNLASVLVLIDSRHPPQQIDLEFLQWLMDEGVPQALVFTKTDRSKPNQLKKNIELFEAEISAWGRDLPVVLPCSAETRSGRPQLLSFIGQTLRGDLAAPLA